MNLITSKDKVGSPKSGKFPTNDKIINRQNVQMAIKVSILIAVMDVVTAQVGAKELLDNRITKSR